MNPFGLIFGTFNVNYETVLSDKGALYLFVAYTSLKATVGDDTDAKVTGFGLGAGYKFYFSKANVAPRGWYLEPNAGYVSAKAGSSDTDEDGGVNYFSIGALAGYQWVFGGQETDFALDLGLGFNYLSALSTGSVDGANVSGIIPAASVSIGYAI